MKVALICAAVLAAGTAAADDWPAGPIELVIPSRPGGGTDIMGRIFADYLQKAAGVPVAVVNQPAGGGTVAFEQVRNAGTEGRVLLFNHTGLLVNAHTGRYPHGLEDFTTVAIAQSYPPQVFSVAPDAPWQTLRDFVEDARAHPGERTIGVQLGGTTHFIAGALMAAEDIRLRLVEAAAEVDKVAGVQGGFMDIGNLGAASAAQFEQAGDMRTLCMIDPEPDPGYPGLRTCQSTGVNVTWRAPLVVWGPAGMDPAVVAEINAVVAGFGDDPVAAERLAAADGSFRPYSVEAAQAFMAEEDAKIGQLAAELGLDG